LAAARNGVEIAEANRLDVSRRRNPALSFESEGYPLLESSRPAFFNNQELTVRFDQEIELAGRRRLRTEAGDLSVEVARARFDNDRRLLTLQVQRAYLQAVLAKADRDVANVSLGEIDRALTLNRARFEKGETSGGEVRRLQVERLRFVDDVFAADLALRNARSALLTLLNVAYLGQTFDVIEPLEPSAPTTLAVATVNVAPGGSPLIAQAITRRPDVAATQRELARTETDTRLQRALRTPNVTVGGGYRRDFGSNAVVFGATVPLPLFNRNQGGVARAEAERRQATNLALVTESAVKLEVQQALNAVAINRERVEYIQREHLTNARESRDIVEASYRLGAADLIDFLDAQRAFRDTLRTYNRALYEQRVSLFELAAAAALPPPQQ
jgi:cobalt-zinc-cadmium efflux system outer membrane protein